MKNDYLDKLVFKPDYVVTYNEDGTYSGKALNEALYKNHSLSFINGYAASKSHPDEPVLISISLPLGTVSAETAKNLKVHKLNPDTYLKEAYTGRHDLFIYVLARNAILAGKEMALYDEANSYVEACKEKVSPLVQRVESIINNPLYRHIGQGFVELLTKEYEQRKKEFDPAFGKAKDKAKETYDNAKSGVTKLLDELKKAYNDEADEKAETPDSAHYKELTPEYAVMIKSHHNKFTLTIFMLRTGASIVYTITYEMFNDIYNILADEHGDGRMKFNSIMDVISELVNNDMQANPAPKKNRPIQMVQFRDCDVVEQSNLFKRKFNVGDVVRVTKGPHAGSIGTIVNIYRREMDSGKKTVYIVKRGQNDERDFYSYQLEKCACAQEPKISTAQKSYVDELTKRMDDHDRVMDRILDVLTELKNKK